MAHTAQAERHYTGYPQAHQAPSKRMCRNCRVTLENPDEMKEPPQLGHPLTGEAGIYDVGGHAKCSLCGTLWHRSPRGMALAHHNEQRASR